MDIKELITSTSYVTPSRYTSGYIVEYDIKSANINILFKYKKITQDYYDYLSKLPKQDREKQVGLLIRNDYSYYETIAKGITEAKRMLFSANDIQPEYVVRIANDAVYINRSTDLKYTSFDNIKFVQKSDYRVMLKLVNILIFFRYTNDGYFDIDVIGMNDTNIRLHLEYMLSVIAQIIHLIERVSTKDAIQYFNSFYEDYINFNLPKEFYRELNQYSLYKYNYSNFYLQDIENVNELDINYNLYLLRELYSILIERYNFKKR